MRKCNRWPFSRKFAWITWGTRGQVSRFWASSRCTFGTIGPSCSEESAAKVAEGTKRLMPRMRWLHQILPWSLLTAARTSGRKWSANPCVFQKTDEWVAAQLLRFGSTNPRTTLQGRVAHSWTLPRAQHRAPPGTSAPRTDREGGFLAAHRQKTPTRPWLLEARVSSSATSAA